MEALPQPTSHEGKPARGDPKREDAEGDSALRKRRDANSAAGSVKDDEDPG
jgi:hypothetical protein